MGDQTISVNNALESIKLKNAADRKKGLADLKHILVQNQRSSRLHGVKDKEYHKILETLFTLSQDEKSAYIRAKTPTAKTTADGKLSAIASALRITLEVGVYSLRTKTIRAIVDHITQILRNSDETFCKPLVPEYVKGLKVVLEYQPHVEHLSNDHWLALVDLCSDCIQVYGPSLEDVDSHPLPIINSSSRFRSSRSETPSTISSSLNSTRKPSTQLRNEANPTQDLVTCLFMLLSATNAPIIERADDTTTMLLELLQTPSNSNQSAIA